MQIFSDTTLNNGIKIIARQNINLHSINIGFYFKSGIVYETSRTNGISHLVEHLFFRNLNGIAQKDLYYRMEKIGTTMRAKTYADFVRFDMSVSQKYFDEAFEIILQLLSQHNWTEENIQDEKKVVKKQIEFKPSDSFSKFMDCNYFVGTKLNMPIMGSIKSVENLTINKINNWKNTFFNASNVCCVLTGDFSDDNYNHFIKKLDLIDSYPCVIPDKQSVIPKNFCNRNLSSDVIIDTEWDISDVSLTFDINSTQNSSACVDLISSILGEGVGSKLSFILREKEFLTDEIYSRVDTFTDVKRITIEFSVENYDIEKSLIILFSEIINFKSNIMQKDLDASITFFTENQKMILDSPRDYNFYLGWNGFVQEKDININSMIENYKNITINKLLDAAQNIFLSKNLVVAISNNKKIYKKSKLKKLLQTLRQRLDGLE